LNLTLELVSISAISVSSCHPQIVNLDENAGLQSVINTTHARRQTSAPHLTFCGQTSIDTQDRSSYTPFHQKQVLIKPLMIIGRNSVNDQLIGSVDLALKDHELIKVKFGEFKEAKKEISAAIAQTTKSELVGIIGNIAIFYRQHPESEKWKIKIP
jgi:RNA-binding protein